MYLLSLPSLCGCSSSKKCLPKFHYHLVKADMFCFDIVLAVHLLFLGVCFSSSHHHYHFQSRQWRLHVQHLNRQNLFFQFPLTSFNSSIAKKNRSSPSPLAVCRCFFSKYFWCLFQLLCLAFPLQTWCWPLPVLCPHVCFVHSVVVLVFCLISGGRLFTHVPEGTRLTFKACVVLLVIFLHWHVHSLHFHLHKFVFHILDFHLYFCSGTYSTYNVGDIGRFVSTNTRLSDLNQLKIGIGHTRWTEPVNDMMFFRWES